MGARRDVVETGRSSDCWNSIGGCAIVPEASSMAMAVETRNDNTRMAVSATIVCERKSDQFLKQSKRRW